MPGPEPRRWKSRLLPQRVLGRMLAAWLACFPAIVEAGLPVVEPAAVGLERGKLAAMEPLIAEAIAARQLPGCVVAVGRQGKLAWLQAYGHRQLEPEPVPMTTDTVFDLASITKPMATATAIMQLVERERLSLDQPVVSWLPELNSHGKEAITLRDLLTHQSGLIADNPLADYLQGPEVAWERICGLSLQQPVRTKFVYSDVNFIILGELIRRRSGQSVHEFTQAEVFRPLGLRETGYLPSEALRLRAAPTEQRDGRWMQGEVHDPRAFRLGGVAGHAGLFSTAADLAVYAQALLGQGEYDGTRILRAETVARMTQGDAVPGGGVRGLGWDKRTRFSSNRGERFSAAAFGHGGFTGTVLWIDPELELFFIFLSNRVHPNGKGLVNPLAGKIATLIGEAVETAKP